MFRALAFLLILLASPAQADQSFFDYKCKNISTLDLDDSYLRYSKADYVSAISLSISDMNNYKSPDSKKLKVYRGTTYQDGKSIQIEGDVDFNEFKKFIIKDIAYGLPFHDVNAGRSERNKDFREKTGLNYADNFQKINQLFEASENARNEALYGFMPLQVRCTVRVKGDVFPIIVYEKCLIDATVRFPNWCSMAKDDVYLASPENIKDAILANSKRILLSMAAPEFFHAKECRKKLKK